MIQILRATLLPLLATLALLLSPPTAHAEKPAAIVKTSTIGQGTIQAAATFTGSTQFHRQANLASELSGLVEKVFVDEGDTVKAGEALACLNTELLDCSIAAARAALAEQKAVLDNARIDLERKKNLIDGSVISRDEYDSAFYAERTASARYATLEAELESLLTQRRKACVTAKFDGVVLVRHVQEGEWITPSSALFTVAAAKEVEVRVHVPQRHLPALRKGAQVTVAILGEEQEGTIRAIVPDGDPKTRTIPVIIRLRDRGTAAGLEASVTMTVGETKTALIAPRQALVRHANGDGYSVFTIRDGKAWAVPVRVEGYAGDMVGFSSDALKAGAPIVTSGNERLRSGQPVVR
ncbi:multidrug efflux system membrane fusion protein [Desulfobaculum xiamenense]|uniref:Multidrug efflux system membrane fusion protein n=1 Tax=Desulfobaculum xiamenense TaxID=995050 RepID=A0A846QHC0_9BACT|nr:efflux RND transporter periplasmic adaptor subunit [Desulfobaculum xiamenense]NJB66397.1 multidrug efflux system membrane fusion protein [Desulfobaculum xiamenense]